MVTFWFLILNLSDHGDPVGSGIKRTANLDAIFGKPPDRGIFSHRIRLPVAGGTLIHRLVKMSQNRHGQR